MKNPLRFSFHWKFYFSFTALLLVSLFALQACQKSPADEVVATKPSINDIPRLASGKPDFSGIWEATTAADYDLEPHSNRKDAPPSAGIIDGKFIPYLPAALEQRKKNFEQRATLDPAQKGYTLGVPRGIY